MLDPDLEIPQHCARSDVRQTEGVVDDELVVAHVAAQLPSSLRIRLAVHSGLWWSRCFLKNIKTVNDRYEHSSRDSIAERDTAILHDPLMGRLGCRRFHLRIAIVRVSLVQSDMGCPGSLQRQCSVGPLRPGPSSVVIDITSQ